MIILHANYEKATGGAMATHGFVFPHDLYPLKNKVSKYSFKLERNKCRKVETREKTKYISNNDEV